MSEYGMEWATIEVLTEDRDGWKARAEEAETDRAEWQRRAFEWERRAQQWNDELRARIAELEEKLRTAGLTS